MNYPIYVTPAGRAALLPGQAAIAAQFEAKRVTLPAALSPGQLICIAQKPSMLEVRK